MNENTLVLDNVNLVHHTLHKYYPSFAFDEDLIQEAMIGLIKAANRFDESKGVLFSTFAVACIRNAIRQEFVRRCGEQKTVSIDGDEETSILERIGTSKDFEDSELRQSYADFLTTLSDDERTILQIRADGGTLEDAGNVLGYNKATVSKKMRRIKRQWKKWESKNDD